MCSVVAKRMQLRSADFRFKNVFGRRIRQVVKFHLSPKHRETGQADQRVLRVDLNPPNK